MAGRQVEGVAGSTISRQLTNCPGPQILAESANPGNRGEVPDANLMSHQELQRVEGDAAAAEAHGDNLLDKGRSCDAARSFYRAVELYESLLGDRVLAASSGMRDAFAALAGSDFTAGTNALNEAITAMSAASRYLKLASEVKEKAARLLKECADEALERGDIIEALELFGLAKTCAAGAAAQQAANSEAVARDVYEQYERQQDERIEPPGVSKRCRITSAMSTRSKKSGPLVRMSRRPLTSARRQRNRTPHRGRERSVSGR